MPLQRGLSIERMCELAKVSRAGFYRYLRCGWPAEEEVDLRSAVQEVVLEHRWRYGYRRVTVELRSRGMLVNHKRVAGIMREDNLLAFRRVRPLPSEDKDRGAVKIYMRRRKFLVESSRAVLGFSLLPVVAPIKGDQTSAKSRSSAPWGTLIADLEKQIPKLMEEAIVPGVSIAIIEDAKLRWRRAFGVRDSTSKKPVDDETMFEAASMSKPVFAYAVMKLCEKGVIDLDTPLTKYTPERFLEGDPRLDLITARHVLSHTSGFQNWRSEEEPLKIHFTPGEKHLYSGEGYSYLQSVVTHVTAQPIEQYMKANLFVPFAMASSGYVWNDTFATLMARPHDQKGNAFDNKKSTATDAARYGSSGALLTTPTDYAKFVIEVIDPKQSDAFRLNKNSLQEMLRPQVKVTDGGEYSISWALGWRLAHTKNGDVINHGGDNKGFHSWADASVERKSGFVIMTNGENGQELLKKLAPSVAQRLYSLADRCR